MNYLVFIASLFTVTCFAQPISHIIPKTAEVNVRSIPTDHWMLTFKHKEAVTHFGLSTKAYLQSQKQLAAHYYSQRNYTAPVEKAATYNPPIIVNAYEGNFSGGSVPMDNYVAISNNKQLISVVNTNIQFWDMNNDTMLLSRSLNQFSNALGLAGFNNSKFDPKVLYDPEADRFVMIILNGSTPAFSKVILGFSQTNDPTQGWNLYTLSGNPFNDTTWFDYPAVALTQGELFLTGNQVRNGVSWQLGFKQTVIWQINKWKGYSGAPLQTLLWNNVAYNGRPIRNLHPVKGGSKLYGPSQYFLSNRNFDVRNDTIFFLTITDSIGGNPQLQVDILKSDKPYGVAPDAFQPNGKRLATNDGRVLSAFYENGNIQFASNCVDTISGKAAIYFGEITQVPQNPTITSWLIRSDTLEFGYPNISWAGHLPDTRSQSIITFEHSSIGTFPGISGLYYAADEFSERIPIKLGAGILNVLPDSVQRWGDYTGSQPFYAQPGTVWISGTYADNFNDYSNWIAELQNPFGNQTSVQEPIVKNGNVYPNPAIHQARIQFEIREKAWIQIHLFQLNGQKVATLYESESLPGSIEVGFNTESLASGVYLVVVTANQHTVFTQKLIRP